MLTEVLAVFVVGVVVGQLLRLVKVRPRLWTLSAAAASALLFTMGLSIGLERGALVQIIPQAAGTSLLLGASAAVASALVTYVLRGRKAD
ncbi:MAG TPA: hypothetical protein VMS77_00760 [Conexivisphaerales archaeon]|nr:hypothetical protein [Conexivisphaerales archaeon]